MGGCRCSYRNCSVRSDGITHMFHYPVFEKVRCHQWLTNAHKLEFLNLKVSQLKNRVVCQHHFKDDCFMNFMKDKLTFHAVPTLDGPYCDSSQYNNKYSEVLKMFPISLDDIENDFLTLSDKQANFSVKYGDFLTNYGDFLTNFDMMEVDAINNIDNNTQTTMKTKLNHKVESNPIQNDKTLKNTNQNEISPIVNVIQLSKFPSANPSANPLLSSKNKIEHETNNCIRSPAVPIIIKHKDLNNIKISKDSKVRILSDKKILKPIDVMGKLSPSLITRVPENKTNAIIKRSDVIIDSENKSICNNRIPLSRVMDDSTILVQSNEELPSSSNQTLQVSDSFTQDNTGKKIKIAIKRNGTPLSRSLSKNKVNSERVAAIKEKRKFNMKLRDIIESCLDKIDEQHKDDKQSKDDELLTNNSKMQKHRDTQVGSFLSEEPELPSLQQYNNACLEARIEKMENLLLSKIERNSQRIVELKNSLNSSNKISKCTQTVRNEEAHKRQLYKEISHYLSPDVNSLMYEELFINKYVQNTPKSSTLNKKRRKKGYIKK